MTTTQGGYEQVMLADQIANNWQNAVWDAYGTAGYYDPWSLGWASSPGQQVPTLARSQLDAQVTQWGVQNALAQGDLQLAQQQLDAQIAQWAQQNQLDAGNLTGFYNGLPTLAREQLAATIGIANADNFRQWAQMRGSQLLQQQAQDDQMRVAAADSKLQTLALLASQRGPKNFMAYNSVLNSLNSPDLAATDPFGIARELMQGVPDRTNVDLEGAWNAGVPGGGVAMPNMTAPAGSPSAPTGASNAGGGGGVVSSPMPSTATRPAATQSRVPAASGTAVTGNQASDQSFYQSGGWDTAPPDIQAEYWRLSQQMAGDYAQQVANTGGNPGYAKGTPGMSTEPAAVVGDVKRAGDPNPELLLNPTGAPFGIVPLDELSPEARKNTGMTDMNKPMPHYANGTWGDWWQPQGGASIPQGEQPWQNFDWSSALGNMPGNMQQWGQQYRDTMSQWGEQLPDWFPTIQDRRQGGEQPYWNTFGGRPLSFGGGGGTPGGGTPGGGTGGGGTPPAGQPPVGGTGPTTTTGQGYAPERSGRRVGTPFGSIYTNPADSYWSRIPDGYNQQQGRLPAFAEGTYDTNTPFGSFDRFTPQQLVDSPLVKKLTGQQNTDLWQQYGGNDTMTIPGTGTRMPGTLNMADFARMAPSERAMAQGIYETPRSMGGLGLYWEDILQASQRAAPLGARFSNAAYGY